MDHLVSGMFYDSDSAGEAVAELKQSGYSDNISVIAKDEDGKVSTTEVKEDMADDAAEGAAVGGVLGALFGLLAGVSSLAVPGFGTLLVAGPLAATWGITGGALGALGGGLVGALVEAGIPEETARLYEDRIGHGEVLVAVTVDQEDEEKVMEIMNRHNVAEVYHDSQ